jgi:hypothetical protein
MRRRNWISAAGLLAGLVLIGALLCELVCGLSLTSRFPNTPVRDMYLIVSPEEQLYLSIDSAPSRLPFTAMRVTLEDIILAVDPSSPEDVTMSSQDPYIWGNRWPWVEKVTLTVKTEKQRAGFEKLFTAERLDEIRQGVKKPLAYGITKYGILTSEGRMLGY